MTGNDIGDEGANTMSGMLGVNTTLTSLNLIREEEGKEKEKENEQERKR